MADDDISTALEKIKQELIVEGEFNKALESLRVLEQKNPNQNGISSMIRETNGYIKDEDLIHRYIARKNYKMACDRLRKLTKKADKCSRLRILKCECMIYTDNLNDVLLAFPKIKDDATGNDAKLIRSLVAFYSGNLDKAISHCDGMDTDEKADRFLNHLIDLKKSFELGEQEEKQNNYKKAQNHYSKAVELCDSKVNGFCLNKVLVIRALVRRARMSAVLHSYIDCLSDTHRAFDLLEKLHDGVDKKLIAYSKAHAYISLASGNVKLQTKNVPSEFDQALDFCLDYEDIKKDVLSAVAQFEVEHKLLYIGSEKHQKLFESVIPSEAIVKHCLQELKAPNVSLPEALLILTRLPIETEPKEVTRVVKYIVARFQPDKFKTQPASANMAKEIAKILHPQTKESSEDTKNMNALYDRLKNFSITDRANYFNLKPPSEKDNNDNWRRSRLKITVGKKYHPDHFKDPEEKKMAARLYELLIS